MMEIRAATIVTALVLLGGASGQADTLLTYHVHTDPTTVGSTQWKATDQTGTVWVGKGMIHRDEVGVALILRLDRKKFYAIDTKRKTFAAFGLPVDIAADGSPQARLMLEQLGDQLRLKIQVKPTGETRKIGRWNARRYDVTMKNDANFEVTQVVWATKDIPVDFSVWREFTVSAQALIPGGGDMASELAKIEGVPVLIDAKMSRGDSTLNRREELVGVETKPAPAGIYDLPAGLKEEKFNPLQPPGRG
jgi:hypothetical protein